MKDFSSRKKGKSDSDVPLFGRLRTSSAWGVFDFRCEGTASPKDSEAVARQRFSQQEILHGVADGPGSINRLPFKSKIQSRNFRDPHILIKKITFEKDDGWLGLGRVSGCVHLRQV